MTRFTLLLSIVTLIGGCVSSSPQLHTKASDSIVIITAPAAPTPIKLTAKDLAKDLKSVLTDVQVSQLNSLTNLPEASQYYVIGQIETLSQLELLPGTVRSEIKASAPAERGGLMRTTTLNGKPMVLLTGTGVQGTQYTVYDYSEQVLGVDKLAYWTGKKAAPASLSQLSQFKDTTVAPPVVPYLVYFENDVDELANLRRPILEYDWETFTNMIDTLVRLRYNGIEMFDMLGRVEFYSRNEYLRAHPEGYRFRGEYLDKMLDYIHDKGMYIQIDMIMGREMGTLSTEASTCWTKHKQEWIDMWTHYLTNTSLSKADIIAMRPRNPVWDWEYKTTCGEDKATVFTEAFEALGKVVDATIPGATKVVTCYHDGMEIFNGNFNPPKDFIVAWSDNGWSTFDYLPKSTKGYKFGTYMHAGFWLNHDLQDPFPEVIDDTMSMMYDKYDATSYMMVNGQTFRPFIMNLEAFAESARLGEQFDGEQFYLDWTGRYFGEENASDVVALLKGLHSAHEDRRGYVEILWPITEMTAYLQNARLINPGTRLDEFRPVNYKRMTRHFKKTQPRLDRLTKLLPQVQATKKKISEENMAFFHDYIELPIYMYHDIVQYADYLIELTKIKGQYEQAPSEELKAKALKVVAAARAKLGDVYRRRLDGDIDPKFATWYDPSKRRPNNGFPSSESGALIESAIRTNW